MLLPKTARIPKHTAYDAYATEGRINSLKELTELELRRADLEKQLLETHDRIHVLQCELFRSNHRPLRTRLQPALLAERSISRRRMARGELRAEILTRMERAGAQGVRVHELASELGMRAVNIHSWFHSATKRFPEIKKTGPSHYQLTAHPQGTGFERTFSDCKGTLGRDFCEPRRRGEVSQKILDALRNADPAGLTVSEIAERTGSSYRRVHVWISSTGKRNRWIVRLARGTYGLNFSELNEQPAVEAAVG